MAGDLIKIPLFVILLCIVTACFGVERSLEPLPDYMSGCYKSLQREVFVIEENILKRIDGEGLAKINGIRVIKGKSIIEMDQEIFYSFKYDILRKGRNIEILKPFFLKNGRYEIAFNDPDRSEKMKFTQSEDSCRS